MQLVSLANTRPIPVLTSRPGLRSLDLSDSVGLAGLAFVVGGALGFALGAALTARAAGPRYY